MVIETLDLVAITRKAYNRARNDWAVNHDEPILTREERFRYWNAKEQAKTAYANQVFDAVKDKFELYGIGGGIELYVNKESVRAFTKDSSSAELWRDYKTGTLFYAAKRNSEDKTPSQYSIIYTDTALNPERLYIPSMWPWKTKKKRVLNSLIKYSKGVDIQDAFWGAILMLGGIYDSSNYLLRQLLDIESSTANTMQVVERTAIDLAIIAIGFSLFKRGIPRTMFRSKNNEDLQTPIKINSADDENGLYVLDSIRHNFNKERPYDFRADVSSTK